MSHRHPLTQPPRPGDPVTLGPFEVRGRLADHVAGVIFLGQDPGGRQAAVAVLHTAAAGDPAVRDRLRAALEDLPAGSVLAAEPDATVPWAALTHTPDTGPAQAARLLDAAALAAEPGSSDPDGPAGPSAASEVSKGPDFAPHWSGTAASATVGAVSSPAPAGAPAPGPRRSALSIAGLVALALLAVAAVLGVGWGVYAWTSARTADLDSTGGRPARPSPSIAPSIAPSVAPSTPAGSPSRTTTTPAMLDGPPGPVAGPTYGATEPRFRMLLAGLPFEFDAPAGWGCARASSTDPRVMRFTCVHDGGTFPIRPNGSGGTIEVAPCPAPCGPAEWSGLRSRIAPGGLAWRSVDPRTRYAEGAGPDADAPLALAMSRVFTAAGADQNLHLGVSLHGEEAYKKTLQKLLNELHARTA